MQIQDLMRKHAAVKRMRVGFDEGLKQAGFAVRSAAGAAGCCPDHDPEGHAVVRDRMEDLLREIERWWGTVPLEAREDWIAATACPCEDCQHEDPEEHTKRILGRIVLAPEEQTPGPEDGEGVRMVHLRGDQVTTFGGALRHLLEQLVRGNTNPGGMSQVDFDELDLGEDG